MVQRVLNSTVSVTTSSTQAFVDRSAARRLAFSIVPLTSGCIVTVAKGLPSAVANNGIVLTQNQPYVESTSENFQCYQGPIQMIADVAGTVAISEVIDE